MTAPLAVFLPALVWKAIRPSWTGSGTDNLALCLKLGGIGLLLCSLTPLFGSSLPLLLAFPFLSCWSGVLVWLGFIMVSDSSDNPVPLRRLLIPAATVFLIGAGLAVLAYAPMQEFTRNID